MQLLRMTSLLLYLLGACAKRLPNIAGALCLLLLFGLAPFVLLICLTGKLHAETGLETVTLSYDQSKQMLTVSLSPDLAKSAADLEPPEWLDREPKSLSEGVFTGTLPSIEAGNLYIGADRAGAYVIGGLGWLSRSLEPSTFTVRVETKGGHRGLATGELLSETVTDDRYAATFRPEGDLGAVDLFFGPYEVVERQLSLPHGEIRLRTYFKPDEQEYAADYLDATSRYIVRYSDEIGAYPYSSFSVVSAPIPVGLAFDGMTYISEQILGHPYMVGRSLAHEVLHSWWGGGVRIDYESGNWAEGLTSYGADYALAEDRDPEAATAMRRDWLAALSSLPAKEAMPLRAFKSASHAGDQTIGYGKSAMVFHVLRTNLGDEVFASALQEFWQENEGTTASWSQVQNAFEAASGRDLSSLFAQWLDETSLPLLVLENVAVEHLENGFEVQFELSQGDMPFTSNVPITIETENGKTETVLLLTERTQTFSVKTAERPLSLFVDPKFDMLRSLAPGELPTTFRDVFRAKQKSVVAGLGHDVETDQLLQNLFGDIAALDRIEADEIESGFDAVIVLGSPEAINDVRALHFEADLPEVARSGDVRAWVEEDETNRLWFFATADNPVQIPDALSALRYYGNQSFITVVDGKRPSADRWPVKNSPLKVELN